MAIDVRETLKTFLDWRQPGGALSAVGHAAILVAGVYAFSSAQPFQPAVEAVAVDVVSDQQFNEMMKGDRNSKIVAKEPERKVDRVAETKEDKDPGVEKKDVAVQPTKQESRNETKSEPKPEPEQKVAAIVPPTRPPELRVAPPVPKPPVKVEEEEDEIDEQAELLRRKKIEEQKKAEDAAKAADARRKLDEKLKADAEAQKRADEKKKLDEKLKAEEEAEKRAEEKRVADAKKKADAERKAKEDKARKDREAKEAAEENKLFASISNKLQTSKEAPSSTGSTGAAVATRSTAGTATATGKKLSPSDRGKIADLISARMLQCLNYPGGLPKDNPHFRFSISRDGKLTTQIELANRSNDPNFRAFAEAAMRAFRSCQPYTLPEKYQAFYDDWKDLFINLDASGQ